MQPLTHSLTHFHCNSLTHKHIDKVQTRIDTPTNRHGHTGVQTRMKKTLAARAAAMLALLCVVHVSLVTIV